MAVPTASFAIDTLTSRLTNPVFKSHILSNYLEQWQRRILNPQNVVVVLPRGRRTSLLHPRLLSLDLRLHLCSLPICSRFLLPCSSISLLYRLRSRPFTSPMSSLTSTPNSDATPDAKTVRAVIKGRVQGVFYRDWTVGNAKELGLKGWVRNRRDGTVEALFSGRTEKVQEMEQRCRRGPPSAIVTGLDVFPCDDDPAPGFERRPTV